ncbi:MAG: hypothetical protein LLF83_06430 [Methanobacterium sp.]|nr:hypothetical protein [Methanobacterium sp.]
MSIAKIYASGDINNAINGYWGPMFSWVLVPIIYLNPSPQITLFTTKILALIIGFFTLIGIRLLSYRFEINEKIRSLLLLISTFVVLYFALRFNPVDLLLTCFLLYYLYFIYSPNYSLHWYSGLFCGILGAMAYLTKSFALPFFLVHFIFFNLLNYYKDVSLRKGIIKNLFMGLAVFLIIAGSWTVVISEQYGYLTWGTSGKYNFQEIGPIQKEQGSPIWHGFIKPSNEKATSAWEDPTYLEMRSWNPLDSWTSFKYELTIIKDNLIKTIGFLNNFSYFSLIIIISAFLFLLQPIKRLLKRQDIIFKALITIILYAAAYILIFVEFRYLYLIYFLLILMGGHLLNLIFKNQFFTKARKSTILILFIISLLILPINGFIQDKNSGKIIYDTANTIKTQYNIQGNIASNDEYLGSMYLAYLWNSYYYGTSQKNWHPISDSELEKDFKTYNIDYYLVWGDSNANQLLLSKYNEITAGKISNLRIYAVKEGS